MQKKEKGKIIIVVGGQYGSESKGLVCCELTKFEKVHFGVRTGSINAGHTTAPYKGVYYKTQQIPVVWGTPGVKLVIGAGAYVSPHILEEELEMIEKATGKSLLGRLFIDERCGAHLPKHNEAEAGMHERMGSTGEGCSEAIKDKMSRGFDYVKFADTDYAKKYNGTRFEIVDTVRMLNRAYDDGQTILLEGTQGTLLDLHLSHYPYCTSRQTIAANWLAEAGLSPSLRNEVVMVARTYPIRVAGNSGPMPRELSWVSLARRLNMKREELRMNPIIPESTLMAFEHAQAQVQSGMGLPATDPTTWTAQERMHHSEGLVNLHKVVLMRLPGEMVTQLKFLFEVTTVTKKLRRIAELDIEELKYAVMLNRPKYLVLNFMNYLYPSLSRETAHTQSPEWPEMKKYIKNIERETGVRVRYINYDKSRIVQL